MKKPPHTDLGPSQPHPLPAWARFLRRLPAFLGFRVATTWDPLAPDVVGLHVRLPVVGYLIDLRLPPAAGPRASDLGA